MQYGFILEVIKITRTVLEKPLKMRYHPNKLHLF